MGSLSERERQAAAPAPDAAELLRAALEKIVFFEWRVSELAAELSAAQSRCASAQLERTRAEDDARTADQRAKAARLQLADLEAERSRMAALLSAPSRGHMDAHALDAERARTAQLQQELDDARRQIAANRAERERWLTEMIAQARTGDDAPAALAQFISELRGEILALRDHQQKCEALLGQAGISAPAFHPAQAQPAPSPQRAPEPVEQAQKLLQEGRIGGAPLLPASPAVEGIAARALAEQCLRSLTSADAARREQAARHLARVPWSAAAPLIASALGAEREAKTRAQLARALLACGGAGAADIVARLQAAEEPALVRLAALDALCLLPSRAREAVEAASGDGTPALRRRAAAVAAAEGFEDVLSRLALDADASVRAVCVAARREAPAPPQSQPSPRPAPSAALQSAPPRPREPAPAQASAAREVLKRLVLAGVDGGRR